MSGDQIFVRPDDTPSGLSRRAFLQAVGLGMAGGVVLGQGAEWLGAGSAMAGTPIGPNDGVLVLVTLYGGNDGLNTVVPFTNGTYYDQRDDVLAIAPERVLPLDDRYGLHPSLPTLKAMWDAGQVAAVHGVGYNPPNLSHFFSMAVWMSGRFGAPNFGTGWIGRWHDGLPPAAADLAVAEIGVSIPLHLLGARPGLGPVAVPTVPLLIGQGPTSPRLRNGLVAMAAATATERGQWGDAVAATIASTIHLGDQVSGAFPATPLDDGLVGRLTMAARLINANVGLRVLSVGIDGFDTHASQPATQAGLLAQLDTALATFFATLEPSWRNRVTLATLSEFGRTPHSNLSAGTDHGTANVQFVIGANVRGGHHGAAPRLATLDPTRRLISTVDFRSLYGSLLDGWLGAAGGASSILGGGYESLDLFTAGPGAQAPPPVAAPPSTAGYVAISPLRLFDTRDGTGGRTGQVTAGEVWTVPMGGVNDVPGEASAVVLNLTATGATQPTFVTAWNAGTPAPLASNINPLPGRSSPNLVVGRIGHRGDVSFTNGFGGVDLIGDIVGYFDPQASTGMLPLTPRRLLDTRNSGVPLGEEQSLDVQVAGVFDVPADCSAVALNLTATQPTSPSYLTMWPAGEEMPLASSVNMLPGQSVPNMVIATVGAGGKVSIFNRFGSTHVIVDVLGCFRGADGGRLVAMTPTRLLDTRNGTGAPQARVRQTPLPLQIGGVGGVPAAASSAMLNVTAVLPSQPTFVTVYPSGGSPPLASNLNAVAGDIVPNMVLARLGPDGRAMLFNGFGSIDLVADVMGYYIG